MLVYSTRLPIKNGIEQSNCMKLFIEWVTKSPHYPINSIDYDVNTRKDFELIEGNITFSVRHFENENVTISACRLENRESDAVWINDCIFLNENGLKSLLIQLNCNLTNYDSRMPKTNKPRIVRMFIDAGYCRDDAGIPVSDKPIEADGAFYETCVKVMNGTLNNTMPVVYVSCDYWGKTDIGVSYLAKKLSGTAHVFVEKNYETATRLRKDTNGNNAHTGYVGIYYPGTSFCHKHSIEYCDYDKNKMIDEIIAAVWKALTNRLDSSSYNWSQIANLQSRQKMMEWQDMSAKDQAQLYEYMNTFDEELNGLKLHIGDLNRDIYSLQAQVDYYRSALSKTDENACFFKMGAEPNLYASERSDLLYNILMQVKDRYEKGSRPYVLIESLLEANPKEGECERVMEGVRRIFKSGEELTSVAKSELKSLGFTIEKEGGHYKLTFHDPRYKFTVSNSPSESRSGKNLISEISTAIDIGRKI